jgi:hypothetical protein
MYLCSDINNNIINRRNRIMALAIKAIPTLYGEEARRFQEMADETERKYDISPKRDIKKDPRYRAMRTILERSNINY